MVKLNMRLRGGGGDGGVYPLTHAEQKVRPAAATNETLLLMLTHADACTVLCAHSG